MAFKGLLIVMLMVAVLRQSSAATLDAEHLEGCLLRTGLLSREILSINTRNGQCSVDCATKQTTVLSYFKEDGAPCLVSGHHCISGKCQPTTANATSIIYKLDLEIINAVVPDLDQSANGDTDTFVVVSVESGGAHLYNPDDVLCHTFIIQDSDRPQWRFKCRNIPIPQSAYIRFTAYDADPARAEFIGSVIYSIGYLKEQNGQTVNLPLFASSKEGIVGSLRINPFVSTD